MNERWSVLGGREGGSDESHSGDVGSIYGHCSSALVKEVAQ